MERGLDGEDIQVTKRGVIRHVTVLFFSTLLSFFGLKRRGWERQKPERVRS